MLCGSLHLKVWSSIKIGNLCKPLNSRCEAFDEHPIHGLDFFDFRIGYFIVGGVLFLVFFHLLHLLQSGFYGSLRHIMMHRLHHRFDSLEKSPLVPTARVLPIQGSERTQRQHSHNKTCDGDPESTVVELIRSMSRSTMLWQARNWQFTLPWTETMPLWDGGDG